MAKVGVVVRVDKAHASEFADIVARLEREGLGDVEKVDRFLIVHGKVDPGKVAKLRDLEGIASVREEQVYKAI